MLGSSSRGRRGGAGEVCGGLKEDIGVGLVGGVRPRNQLKNVLMLCICFDGDVGCCREER